MGFESDVPELWQEHRRVLFMLAAAVVLGASALLLQKYLVPQANHNADTQIASMIIERARAIDHDTGHWPPSGFVGASNDTFLFGVTRNPFDCFGDKAVFVFTTTPTNLIVRCGPRTILSRPIEGTR